MPVSGAQPAAPLARCGGRPVRTRRRVSLGLAIVVLVGCGQSTPTAATDVAFAGVCDKANEGQRVAVQGYLRLPETFTGDRSVVLRLHETDAHTGSPVGVQLLFGSAPNQVATVPTSFSDEDLSVHLDGGGTAGYGMPVKVSGKMYYPLVSQDFPCALEDVVVEAAG